MDLPDRHEFRLEMPGLSELADLARFFLEQVIAFAGFQQQESSELLEASCAALGFVEEAVESTADVDLPIELRAVVDAEALELSILERGIPLDDGTAEVRNFVRHAPASRVFDHVWWVQRGSEGSELHLRRVRPHAEISTLIAVAQRITEQHLEEAEQAAEPATDSDYEIRGFRPEDAIEVARRFYESYGRSYPNPDLLYPDRIIALNQSGRLHSIVAEAGDGSLVGHYAIERPRLQPIGESGQAVIDSPHRGHGLFTKMHDVLVEAARSLELLGLWSQPTTRHPYSQRMNISHGLTPCGLTLGTTPGGVALRGSSEEEDNGRYSCFLYWYPLVDEAPIALSVPGAFESLVRAIYEARGRAATIETMCAAAPKSSRQADHDVHARFDRGRKSGSIEVKRIDSSSLSLVREAIEMLINIAGAEVLYIDLPITDPCCAWMATELMKEQFILSGIGPRFLGEDSLRLQRAIAPVDLDGLVVEGELGGRIAEEILGALPG